MSNLEEKTPPLITPEKLNERRDTIENTLRTIDKHKNGMSKYHTSEERVNDLRQERKRYVKKKTLLLQKNKELITHINEQPLHMGKYNSYSNDIEDMLNQNVFVIPNVKIDTIVGYYDRDKVNGIRLKFSDGGEKEYGSRITTGGGSKWYGLRPNEYVVKIDREIDRVRSYNALIGNVMIFYTSTGRRIILKGKDYKIDESKTSEEKTFMLMPNYKSWEWHEAEAKRTGYTLASVADKGENDKITSILNEYGKAGSAWLGGKRTNRGKQKGSGNWKWSDGTPWNYTSWNGREPNDWNGAEDYVQIFKNGRWNDLFSYELPAIYSRKIKRYNINTVTSGGSDRQILELGDLRYNNYLDVKTEEKTVTDTKAIDSLEKIRSDVDELIANSENSSADATIEYSDNLEIIRSIGGVISAIDEEINFINDLNNYGKANLNNEGFTNIETKINNFFNNIFTNIFSNNMSMKEGFNSAWYDHIQRLHREAQDSFNAENVVTDTIEYEENRNYMLELIAQKDQVLGNVLMDYMINDTEGSNAEKLYEIMNQENLDKKRKIQINDYYSKTYVEYSYILKIIIVLVAVMILFLILAKYEILDKNISLTAIIIITFIGFLYVLYRLYLLYMKDNVNFDKDRIPYDRQASELIKQGRIKKKPGLSGLGITCIGEDCCTDGMAYDSTKNKCFPIDQNIESTTDQADTFTNFFETLNNMNNDKKSNVIQNNIHEDSQEYTFIEPFMNSEIDARKFKTDILVESLNNSSDNKMFFKKL